MVIFLQEIRDAENKEVDCYEVTCRQMAYDAEMWDLVDLIDDYNGEAWTYGKKKDRQPRLKKPLELKIQVSSIFCYEVTCCQMAYDAEMWIWWIW